MSHCTSGPVPTLARCYSPITEVRVGQRVGRRYCGWTKSILHHPRSNEEPLVVGIYRGIIIPKVSSVVQDLVHPQYGPVFDEQNSPKKVCNVLNFQWFFLKLRNKYRPFSGHPKAKSSKSALS